MHLKSDYHISLLISKTLIIMDERMKNHAVLLFHEKYRKDPETEGLKIDYYQAKDMFLYSTSQEAIKAFKICQNILMWLMKYFLGSLFGCFIIEALVLIKFSVAMSTAFYVAFATWGVWVVIFLALAVFCVIQERKIKKNPVIFIPNEEDED